MSQKPCAECGELIDASAKACPECGNAPRKAFALWGFLMLAVGSIVAWIGILLFFPLTYLTPLFLLAGIGLFLLAPFVRPTTDRDDAKTDGHSTAN